MDSVSNVGVLDKAVAVLRALERDGPSGLAELRRRRACRAPRPTASPRRSSSTAWCGATPRTVVPRAGAGRARPCCGGRVPARRPRPAGADRAARRDRRESVQLFVREGEGRRCVVSLQSAHGLRWIVAEGALLPLHVGSAGRVLSGELGPAGWIESVEEREAGVASVSAPVVDGAGRLLAAVSVSGPVERLSRVTGGALRRGGDLGRQERPRCGILRPPWHGGRATQNGGGRPASRATTPCSRRVG